MFDTVIHARTSAFFALHRFSWGKEIWKYPSVVLAFRPKILSCVTALVRNDRMPVIGSRMIRQFMKVVTSECPDGAVSTHIPPDLLGR